MLELFDEKYVKRLIRDRRGVAVFVPTRAEVEQLAEDIGSQYPRLTAAFYHGGEPIRVIRPFLEGEVERPFLLAMTAAGQSALNVRGLDTVVIYDARYANKVDRGRNVLHRLYLGANEILQMAGRVHGRVANGEVVILSDRPMAWNPEHTNPPGGLPNYFRDNVIGGPGAFVVVAEDFNSFGQAIVKKLIAEIAEAPLPRTTKSGG